MNDLPIGIGTVASRTVVPVMSVLFAISPANLLTLEAVATALVLDATIVTAVESTLLERTARAAHIDVVVVELK